MTAPLKIDDHTDQVASHAAHFLGVTKKQYVADAVEFYTAHQRADIERGVKIALEALDGSCASRVQLLSGLSMERIDELGGTD